MQVVRHGLRDDHWPFCISPNSVSSESIDSVAPPWRPDKVKVQLPGLAVCADFVPELRVRFC